MSGITTANLTDTGAAAIPSPSVAGPARIADRRRPRHGRQVVGNVTLTNTSLAVTGHADSDLERDHGRQPHRYRWRQHVHRQRLDGDGSLTDSAATGDTVDGQQGAGFTLTNTSLSSTDGMSLGLSGITTANLTDTAGGNTFTSPAGPGAGR